MNRLAGKVCVVTGAGQGIGRAIAQRFADEGAVVVAAQRRPGDRGVDALGAAGSPAAYVRTDVTRPEEVAALFAQTLDRFGRVDVLCNNAARACRARSSTRRLRNTAG